MCENAAEGVNILAGVFVYRRTYMVVPAKAPADPRPFSARPIMNAGDVGAAAVSIEPPMKRTSEAMKSVFMEKKE